MILSERLSGCQRRVWSNLGFSTRAKGRSCVIRLVGPDSEQKSDFMTRESSAGKGMRIQNTRPPSAPIKYRLFYEAYHERLR
jgi:hypothetical protein